MYEEVLTTFDDVKWLEEQILLHPTVDVRNSLFSIYKTSRILEANQNSLLFGQNVPKNCMKMKETDPEGSAVPGALLDPSIHSISLLFPSLPPYRNFSNPLIVFRCFLL